MIDYQALLKKYMQHVCEWEGSTGVHAIERYSDMIKFTGEEKKVLENIEEGLRE